MNDFNNLSGTNGFAAFTDGELGASFQSNWVDQANSEGNVVTWHNHFDIGWEVDGAGDIGGTEEELWTIAF